MFVIVCNYKLIENQLASPLLRPPSELSNFERKKIREHKRKSPYFP
jgi:hypothetical protein